MQVTIDPEVLKELQYLVDLHKTYGAPIPFDRVEGLVAYILASIADGSRRPEAWERSMLESLGIVAYCDQHEMYRAHYQRSVFSLLCGRTASSIRTFRAP